MPVYKRYAEPAYKYGDTDRLYGLPSPADGNLLWTFMVDWNSDGYYSGDNEATRMVDLHTSRGRDYLVAPRGQGFEHMQYGEAVAIFDNEDGRLDPYNTSSPLYPNVKPGKFVRILVKDGSAGTNYPILRGVIEDIQPLSRRQQVRIVVKDGLTWLRNREASNGLRQNVNLWAQLNTILTGTEIGADWPTAEWSTSFDTAVTTQSKWWAWKENALKAINDLEDLEFGVCFIARNGTFTFYARDHDYGSATVITQSEVLDDIAIPQPWEVVRNLVRVYSYPKVTNPVNTTLWQLQDVPAINNGGTFVVDAIFRYSSYYPVCGAGINFNHTVNTKADGTGTNISASCPLTYGGIGAGVRITITNNSGSNGYITLLRTVGDAIYNQHVGVREATDATSQDTYGTKDLTLDDYWQENTADAQSYVNFLVEKFKDPLVSPVIQLENRTALQFGTELMTLINFQSTKLGIDANFRLGKIEHQFLKPNGQAVRTTFKLEPRLDPGEGYWTFTTNIGTTSIFGF